MYTTVVAQNINLNVIYHLKVNCYTLRALKVMKVNILLHLCTTSAQYNTVMKFSRL